MPHAIQEKPYLATTIIGVIHRLDDIIQQTREQNSRLGYFATLYREVTISVQLGIAAGDFEDGARMEKLDVIFANRYLEALHQFERGGTPSKCWLFAFQFASKWRPLILQHLLLGINAHINLDLGIAAAETAPAGQLDDLKNDFYKINAILASLLDVAQDKINVLSHALGLLDTLGDEDDEALVNFSIERARDEAWAFAQELSQMTPEERTARIATKDEAITELAQIVANPGWFLRSILFLIRLLETNSIRKAINVLI